MPRTPLKQPDSNSKRGKELTPYLRGQIIAYYKNNVKIADIARQLQIPASTVKSTTIQHPKRRNGESLPRSGRPKALSARDERRILLETKRDPGVSFADLRQRTGIDVSAATLRKYLRKSGYGHGRVAKEPGLEQEHAD